MLRHHEHFIHELGLASYKPRAPSLVIDPRFVLSVPRTPFFVICPGAAESLKRWPVANFARLAEAIV
jgi:ADP-heptose:LPS heptosyltransferase